MLALVISEPKQTTQTSLRIGCYSFNAKMTSFGLINNEFSWEFHTHFGFFSHPHWKDDNTCCSWSNRLKFLAFFLIKFYILKFTSAVIVVSFTL